MPILSKSANFNNLRVYFSKELSIFPFLIKGLAVTV
jgi:hypothetical protein